MILHPGLIVAGIVTGLAFAWLAAYLLAGWLQQRREAARASASGSRMPSMAMPAFCQWPLRPGCGCTFWDWRGDRAQYIPCAWHAAQIAADAAAFPLPPEPLDRDYIEQRGRRK